MLNHTSAISPQTASRQESAIGYKIISNSVPGPANRIVSLLLPLLLLLSLQPSWCFVVVDVIEIDVFAFNATCKQSEQQQASK